MSQFDSVPPVDQLGREELIETTRKVLVEAQALSTRIAVLNEIATAINETLEITQILATVKKKAKWLLDFSYCSVTVKHEAEWQIEHLVGLPLEEIHSDDHPIRQTLQTGRPYRNTPPNLPFNSFLVVPIQLGSEIIGSLNFGRTQATYTQDDVRIAYMLSQQLAAAFRNAMQFEALNRTLAELHRTNSALDTERKISESLLQNILPQTVAAELKITGAVNPVYFPSATVMFIDFKGFTAIAREATPASLVNQLNWYFTRFDEVCTKYYIEKLKTIGDAFMCVSGVPQPNPDHTLYMVCAALDMLAIVHQPDAPGWKARVGIHTGELVAGVIGKHKFSFDVWGNTVNIAARVETYGEVGKINLSAVSYQLVKDEIPCSEGEKVEVPNLGLIQLYQVKL